METSIPILPIANNEPIQLPSSSVNGLIKVQLFKFGLKFTESLWPLHFVKNGNAGDVQPMLVPKLNDPIQAGKSYKINEKKYQTQELVIILSKFSDLWNDR